MTRIPTNNPLGGKAHLYLEKQPSKGSIHLKPREETLEFYPAGYTKVSPLNGKNRQSTLQSLYEIAVHHKAENILYPFDEFPYTLQLAHQRNNPKDPHAMYVVLRSPVPGSMIGHLDGCDLGYVPMRISEEVHKHMDLFNGGRILKIRANFHKKYYTCKVIFGYGQAFISSGDFGQTTRFIDLADEL